MAAQACRSSVAQTVGDQRVKHPKIGRPRNEIAYRGSVIDALRVASVCRMAGRPLRSVFSEDQLRLLEGDVRRCDASRALRAAGGRFCSRHARRVCANATMRLTVIEGVSSRAHYTSSAPSYCESAGGVWHVRESHRPGPRLPATPRPRGNHKRHDGNCKEGEFEPQRCLPWPLSRQLTQAQPTHRSPRRR